MTDHSPTPEIYQMLNADGSLVAEIKAIPSAMEKITRAVNAHDNLVAALRIARNYVAPAGAIGQHDCKIIDAALAKAGAA